MSKRAATIIFFFLSRYLLRIINNKSQLPLLTVSSSKFHKNFQRIVFSLKYFSNLTLRLTVDCTMKLYVKRKAFFYGWNCQLHDFALVKRGKIDKLDSDWDNETEAINQNFTVCGNQLRCLCFIFGDTDW